MTVLNLVKFGGLQCCHRAVRMCCQMLLAVGLLAGLSLLAAAAILHGNSGPDVRLVALVYIGGLVVCVCGGLLVVFCASTAVDPTLPEVALISTGDFWSDSCASNGGFHGTFGLKNGYFADQRRWAAKEACCPLTEFQDDNNKFCPKLRANGSSCVLENTSRCNDKHMYPCLHASSENHMFENKLVHGNGCSCGNLIITEMQHGLQKCQTSFGGNNLKGVIVESQPPQNAAAAEERGCLGHTSCGKRRASEKMSKSFSHCGSQRRKNYANCQCFEYRSNVFCQFNEGRNFPHCASEKHYMINSPCQVHNQNRASCKSIENLNEEIISVHAGETFPAAKKSRYVNFSPEIESQMCTRKVDFCGACEREITERGAWTPLCQNFSPGHL